MSNTTHVDILSTLPQEVLDEIFQYLSTGERWIFASVSCSWRSLLLNWQPHWKCLSTNDHGHSIVPDIIPYIPYINKSSAKKICITTDDVWQIFKIVAFIKTYGFYAISTLDLNVEYFTTTNLETLVDTCGESLKYITIEGLDEHEANVRPDTLLISCPNLIKLNFQGCIYMDDDWKPDLKTKICHHLTDLELDFSNSDNFYELNLLAFLRAAPKLQSLTVNVDHLWATCSNIPIWIKEYCPDLTTLVLRQEFEYDEGIPPISSSITTIATEKEHDHQDRKGLQHFYLRGYNNYILFNEAVQMMILSLLDINRSQLVTLDLGGPEMICEITLTQLASSPMPSLKALQLINYNDDVTVANSSTLCTLFQPNTMPNLTHLTIFCLKSVDGSVLEAIAFNLNCLKELVLYHCENVRGEGLLQFLRQIGEKKRKVHLRSLAIRTWVSIPITEGVLEILASEENGFIEHLEELNLGAIPSTMDGCTDILRFLEAKQEKIKNNKKKMKRLDIFFLSGEFLEILSDGLTLRTDCQIKQLLAKIDQVASEWEYSEGIPELDAGISGVVRIFGRVSNLTYERS
ncbi:hypothetical protein BDC45DRAFT_75215 [Circinella umbellata]|nr:hypothetical protein BDC45DRAFT_75215 [Circinella umbellata]